MNTLTIDKKKYVVIEKKHSLKQGKELAYSLIDKWQKESKQDKLPF